MAKLLKNFDDKDQLKEAKRMITQMYPKYLQMADNFIEMYFYDERKEFRKDAIDMLKMILNKTIPNISVVRHEESGYIDPELAALIKKSSKLKEVDAEVLNEEE